VVGVASSEATAQQAASLGIPLTGDPQRAIDLAVDGADEVDPALNLVKGRGGALLREKVVARLSRQFVVVADESKLVDRIGVGPVPVEVFPFLWRATARRLESLASGWSLRGGEAAPYRTDNANLIVDLHFDSGISDVHALDAELSAQPGVADHGLFVGLASRCIVAGRDGQVRYLGA
jgi:ribose 5-phosphate isomerase A